MEILILLAHREGQYKCNLNQINEFYKKSTNADTFNIEKFADFQRAFKDCDSIGKCSILAQIAVNSYLLYDNVKDILRDREYYKKILNFMIKYSGRDIYKDVNVLHQFINHNNAYFYSYQDLSNVELFKLIAELQVKLCPDLLYDCVKVPRKINPKRPIKVGFVSDFINSLHSVTKDRLGIIKHLYNDLDFDVKIMSRKSETDIFFNNVVFDNIDTEKLIVKMDSEDLVKNRTQIAEQNFDIIVYPEIGMCPRNRWIAFSRLAPIQINTWGHSDTSGLPNIDYFVSSKYFNSPEDQEHYSEKLILFNSLGTYYYNICKFLEMTEFMNNDPEIFRNKVIEKTGVKNPNIYGCIQIFFKMHPVFVKMLDNILKMDPNGVIVLLSSEEGKPDHDRFVDYINKRITHKERLYFIYQVPFIQYACNIKNCDLILDYFPFGGFNSTIESFALGKVCITRPGRRISGRFTQGLYNKMGITEFICKTDEEYVKKAVEYGTNREKREEYENLILDKSQAIFEENESIDEWKELLKNLYKGKKLSY